MMFMSGTALPGAELPGAAICGTNYAPTILN